MAKPPSPISHIVLLDRIDSEFYYFKNSSAKEKEIKIPKSRSTLDQYTILQACSNSSIRTIPERIFKENIPGFNEDWMIDSGFLLKLTKK